MVPLFAQTGIIGLVALIFYWLHRDAIASERRRADDWRLAAQAAQARADERDRQLAHVLAAVPRAANAPEAL